LDCVRIGFEAGPRSRAKKATRGLIAFVLCSMLPVVEKFGCGLVEMTKRALGRVEGLTVISTVVDPPRAEIKVENYGLQPGLD
jgi:hypothetical protein